jgi:hypothetical protein
MTAADVLSIVVPGAALLAVAVAGEPRWTRRPWPVRRAPNRRMLAFFFAGLLAAGVIHALI